MAIAVLEDLQVEEQEQVEPGKERREESDREASGCRTWGWEDLQRKSAKTAKAENRTEVNRHQDMKTQKAKR